MAHISPIGFELDNSRPLLSYNHTRSRFHYARKEDRPDNRLAHHRIHGLALDNAAEMPPGAAVVVNQRLAQLSRREDIQNIADKYDMCPMCHGFRDRTENTCLRLGKIGQIVQQSPLPLLESLFAPGRAAESDTMSLVLRAEYVHAEPSAV